VATARHTTTRQRSTERNPAAPNDRSSTLALVGRQVVDSAQEAFVSISADGVVEVWNAAAESMFGWSEEDAVGRELATLIVPAHLRDAHRRGLERFALTGRGEVTGRRLSMPAVRRDGSELPVEMTILPVSVGERVIFQAFLHDVSKLAVAELAVADRALREAHDRFEKAFRNAPIGMALVAPTGRFVAANAALCTLLDRDESQLLATDFHTITHPEDLEAGLDLVERLLSGSVPSFQLEKRYLRPDGSAVWALLSVSLVRDADERPLHFVSQIQDITAAKQAEDELRRYTEHLHALSLQDALTELPNRRELLSALDGELQRARRAMAAPSASSCSTSSSSPPTTVLTATSPAMTSCAPSPTRYAPAVASRTPRHGSAVTTSRCCCPRPPTPAPTSRRGASGRRSSDSRRRSASRSGSPPSPRREPAASS